MASYYKYDTAHGQRWQCRFRVVDSDGKYKQKTLRGYETKKAAEKAYIKYVEDLSKKEIKPTEAQMVTVGQATREHIQSKKHSTKESSVISQMGKYRLILASWENVPIADISPSKLLEWQNGIMEQYPSSYGIAVRELFNSIITLAHKYHKTNNDIIEAVDKPKLPEQPIQEMQIWTPEEYKKVSDCLEEPYLTYFDFLFLSGCRKSEAAALQVEDIDFDKRTVNIKRSLTRKTEDASYKLTTPKNRGSVRSITMPDRIMLRIKETLQGRNEGFVFVRGGDNLSPLADTSVQRAFSTAIKQAKQKPIRIHDLRHSHASLLISQGVSIVAVSKRLGHADVKETLNTYAHLLPKDTELIDNILDNINLGK